MMNKSDYEMSREDELLWLITESGIDQYRECNDLDEAEYIYRNTFPAFYEGSVRRWMGWHEGVHKWADGDSFQSE